MINVVDIRKRGMRAIEEEIENKSEVILSYKGKPSYVIIPMEKYEKLIENDLEDKYQKVLSEYQNGDCEEMSNLNDLQKHTEGL